MKVLILSAGYSTRLYPLTKNFPKPLLDINGKAVIDFIIEKLKGLDVYVVTNNKYYNHFLEWKENLKTDLNIEIINDKTNSEEDKLGAIGDINFVINEKNIDEDLLIIGGDNLFDFELDNMLDYFKRRNKDVISVAFEEDKERLKQLCSVKLEDSKIVFFEEKPSNPLGNLYSNCIYIYTKDTVKLIKEYLEKGNNPDQPGRFVQWLYSKKDVYGYLNKGRILDIGTKELLEEARKEF